MLRLAPTKERAPVLMPRRWSSASARRWPGTRQGTHERRRHLTSAHLEKDSSRAGESMMDAIVDTGSNVAELGCRAGASASTRQDTRFPTAGTGARGCAQRAGR